jgi:flagellar hook assembly protein FlgD
VPGEFSLSQNYPNPFNPSTKIDYQLEKDQTVTLAVYDLAGRIIRTLFEGAQKAGAHTIEWDGRTADHRAVSSGTYFFTIRAGNEQKLITKKMIVIR